MKWIFFLLSRTGLLRKLFGDNIGDWIIGFGIPAVITYLVYKAADGEKKDADGILLYLSALVPLLGIIFYFVRKEENKPAAQLYLGSAVISGVLNIIIVLAS